MIRSALPAASVCLAVLVSCSEPTSTTETSGEPAGPPAGPAWFEDIAQASGIDFVHDPGTRQLYFPEIIGSGVAFFDYDRDGDVDLYAVQSGDLSKPGSGPNRLYRNDDGQFTDVTKASGTGDGGYGMGAVVGDYDRDGLPDLYVTNVGANALLRNRGDGTFEDVTAAAGVGHEGWGMSGVFFHADQDGDLDLFVTNYVNWSPETEIECTGRYGGRDYCEPVNYNAPAEDVLYLNNGDGTFELATAEMGLAAAFGNGMGVSCGDFNGDGRDDLYVANDGTPNQLWLGREGGFDEGALLAGCAVNGDGYAEASMGAQAVDADEDGDLDLFLTHLRGETNTLYLNEGGVFSDRTSRAGMSRSSLRYTGFGTLFADFDLDGVQDIYVVNGRVGNWKPTFSDDEPYAEPNLLFRGISPGRWEEVGPQGGTQDFLIGNSRGLAVADIDNDGDLDLAILENEGPLRLLRNICEPKGSWVSLNVLNQSGAEALGAQVTIRAGGRTRVRRVEPAYSYLSSNDPRLHLGFSDADSIEQVTVSWPGGDLESFGPLEINQGHTLQQGQGQTAQ